METIFVLYLIMTKNTKKKVEDRIDSNDLPLEKAGKRSFDEVIKIVRKVQKKIEEDPRKYLSRSELKEYGCIL